MLDHLMYIAKANGDCSLAKTGEKRFTDPLVPFPRSTLLDKRKLGVYIGPFDPDEAEE